MGRISEWYRSCYGKLGGITDLTVTATTDGVELYGGKVASDLQSDVAISDGKITGSLKFIEGGLAPSGYLAGDGYFMALTWSAPKQAENITSVKVGLVPSAGSGMIEGIGDPDRTIVAKVDPSLGQQFLIEQRTDNGEVRAQYFELDFEFEEPDSEG